MEYRINKDGVRIDITRNGKKYQETAKEYVINMWHNKKMLHRKNACYHSKYFYEHTSFDTLEEVEQLPFRVSRCEKCFPNQNETD